MYGTTNKAKDYYAILGVAESATTDEIRRAYRKLARRYHPDVSKESDAEERFKEVNEANDILKDPKKRAAYDRIRKGGFDPNLFGQGGFNPQSAGFDLGGDALKDLFETMFGGGFGGKAAGGGGFGGFGGFGSRGPTKGQNIEATLAVTLEVAFHGGPQRLSVGGKSLQVKIPAGVADGQKIRLSGQGHPSPDGGQAGDLMLNITISAHHRYELDGRNLLLKLPITPWEAALGGPITVQTLNGEIELKVPAGARSGQKLRLRGRGMPGEPAGDLMIQLMIQTPPADTDELRQAYESLAELSKFSPRN